MQVGCLFSDVTEYAEAHATIQAQREPIRELATPILELDGRVLVAPLVGDMDTTRVRQLTERLLQRDHGDPRPHGDLRRRRRARSSTPRSPTS